MKQVQRAFLLFGLSAFMASVLMPGDAFAISVELAKKCRAMAIKAHPTVLAGSAKGSAEGQRAFFQNCVTHKGDVEIPPASPEAPH